MRAYRQDAVKQVARANISFDSFGSMTDWIDENSKDELKLGNSSDLARDHAPDVFKSQVEDIINLLKMKCFNHYSSISDGTSSFAPAEAIIV